MSKIKDIALAPSGELKIDWVKRNCPLLRTLEGEFAVEKPFAGLRIALSVHLEAKTAYLCRVLAAGGAELMKIHFHTDAPWKLLEYCASLGEIYDVVIEDMSRQTRGLPG